MDSMEIEKNADIEQDSSVIDPEFSDEVAAAADLEEGEEIQPETELETALRERDEFLDLLQRKQAEFENYKRRVDREKSELRFSVRSELMEQILDVVDACEKGLESLRENESEELGSFVEGYELLQKQLKTILDRYEVSETPGVGSPFDPNLHEALIRETTGDHEEGEILQEYRKGYTMGDRLLRPSQVKVAAPAED
jgi:molecular chaperone GrpE